MTRATDDGREHWRFLPTGVKDGPTNMATDEAILIARGQDSVPNTVRVYQWAPSTVTIGRHQSVATEVDEDDIRRRGFQLVRRISGGGAVLHAESMEITYSVVARVHDLLAGAPKGASLVDAVYASILSWIQRTLERLSLPVNSGVIHCPALLVAGKKFSGNAQCIKKNVVLQHGTILLKVDPDVMYSVLRPPAGITKTRMVRSVMAKVIGIEEMLGRAVSVELFSKCFKESVVEMLGVVLQDGMLTPGESSLVATLREKYASSEWTGKYP